MKTIVRGDHRVNSSDTIDTVQNGIPKTSNVARSNSLRSSSPPKYRRGDFRNNTNLPPSVPEGEILNGPVSLPQYPSSKRDLNFVSRSKK